MNTVSLNEHVHGDISRIMEEVITDACRPLARYRESLVPALPKAAGLGLELDETAWGNLLTDVQVEIRRATEAHPRARGVYSSFTITADEKVSTWKEHNTLGEVRKALANKILKQLAYV